MSPTQIIILKPIANTTQSYTTSFLTQLLLFCSFGERGARQSWYSNSQSCPCKKIPALKSHFLLLKVMKGVIVKSSQFFTWMKRRDETGVGEKADIEMRVKFLTSAQRKWQWPGNTNCGGRLSTVDLLAPTCLVILLWMN